MADSSSEHVIRLIVQGINRLGNVVDQVTKETEKLTGSQEKHTKSVKESDKAIEELRKEHARLVKEIKDGNKTYDEARFHLARVSAEFDKLARKQPIGSKLSEDLNRSSLAAKRLSEQLKLAHETERRLNQEGTRDHIRMEEERQRRTAETLRQEVQGEQRAAQARKGLVAELLAEVQKDHDERKRFARELSDFEIKEAVRVEEARTHSRAQRRPQELVEKRRSVVERVKGFFGGDSGGGVRKFVEDVSGLSKGSDDAERRVSRLDRTLARLHGTADRTGFSVAKIDNNLRGLLLVGVVAFSQQIISSLVSLAATLFSVGSAAVQAGAAIGGAFVAAAGQSIPVIGLLIAAFGRIGAVFDAVKLFNKETTRSGRDQAAAADAQAAAADRVASAQEGVVSAAQRVRDATEALTKSREDALRNIQDLNLAERAASAGGFQAETALRRAISGGDVGALEGLRVQRDEASLRARRATTDAGQARAQGVEGSDQVRQAVRTLDDANVALGRARREMESANRAATKAAESTSSADDALKEALAQLTPAELALYESVKRIQKRFKELYRPVTDIIVRAFSDAVDRVRVVMGDPRVLGPLRQIAEQIGVAIRRITRELTNERSLNFFKFMAREAARNLPLLTSMGIKISRIFAVIARAASPALRQFLQFFDDLLTKGNKATDSKSGLSRLQRFFLRGEEMAESFFKLTGAVIGLFAALAGAGAADTGQSAVDQLTEQINKATDWVNENQGKVKQFFQDSLDAAKAIAGALFDIGKFVTTVFDSERVKDFARVFSDVLLPALLPVVIALGAITDAFAKLLDLPVVGNIAQFAISIGLLHKVFTVFLSLLGPFASRLVVLLGRVPLLGKAIRAFAIGVRVATAIMAGPWGIAIAAIITGIVLLDRKFHFIRPVIRFLGRLFKDVFNAIADVVSDVAPKVAHFLGGVIGGAFHALKDVVIGFTDTFLGAITTILGAISSVASAGSSLPGRLGRGFEKTAEFIDGARDRIDAFRESLRNLGKEQDSQPTKIKKMKVEVLQLRTRLGHLKEGTDEYRETAIRLRHRQDDLNVAMQEAEQKGKQGARGPRTLGDAARSAAGAVDSSNKSIVGSYNQIAKQLGGIKPLKYSSLVDTARGPSSISSEPPVPGLRRATGGWIGRSWGQQGPDNRMVLAGDGEAFLNRPQQGPVEEGLALRSMILGGPGNLTELFKQFGGAFAAGGRVGGIDLKGASSNLMRYAVDAMRYGLNVSSGLRTGAITSSGNQSNHALGKAIDLAGSAKDMLRFGLHAASAYGRKLLELIHTPMRFGIKGGKRVPLSFWGARVNADHFDHVHLAAGEGGPGGGVSSGTDQIGRQRIRGPAGMLRDLAQRSVDRIRRAANDKIGGSFSLRPDSSGKAATTGANANQIRRWIIAGLQLAHQKVTQRAIATLFGRVMQESSGSPTIVNTTDINARRGDPSIGLLQTTGGTFRRYAVKGHENIRNPVDNVAAAVRYMLARYGHLVGAGPGGYQTGGFVGKGTTARRTYQAPAIFNQSFRGLLDEIKNAQAVTARLLTRGPKFFRDFGRSIAQIIDEGGLLDQAKEAIDKEVSRVALKLKKATFLVTKSGTVIQRLSQQQLDLLQPAAIDEQREMLQDVRRAARRSLSDVNRRLAIIRRGGVTDKERKTYETLIAAQRKLLTQISDLDTAVADTVEARFNAQVTILQDAIDAINKQAQQTLTRADLADRVANVVQGLGQRFDQTAFALRGGALQARASAMITQRDRLSKAAQIATVLGKGDIAQDLIAQVEELNVALFENAAAIRSNTVAARQATIDAITNRGGFLTGITSGLSSIIQTIGARTGTLDVAGLQDLNKQAGVVLKQTGDSLRQQLGEAFGINLLGAYGDTLVRILSNLNIDQIEAGMSVEQRQQFESLINAIIDNAGAIETNTQALQDLSQTVEQSFSSTAWQLFRQAIFNGSGGLLPQYSLAVPMMQSGGTILSDGLLYGHRSERIVPAQVSRDSTWGSGDTNNIYITSPTEVADPDHIARALSFHRSLGRAVN